MSKNHWRIKKQSDQSLIGKTVIEKVRSYERTWEDRCYSSGIPDEIPNKLMKSKRVPSYKAITMAILRNDFKVIGFEPRYSDWYEALREKEEPEQMEMWSLK